MKVLHLFTGVSLFLLLGVGAAGGETRGGSQKTGETGRTVLQAATGFIGLEVRDSGGNPIGEVRDLLLDTRRERLAYAVVATGGVLGIGDDIVVVPWRFLRFGEEGKFTVLPVHREKLLRTPKRAPDQSDDDFARAVERYYGIPPYWEDRPEEPRKGKSR